MKFSISRLATLTGLSTGEIKYFLDVPIKSVCKAKTFDKALNAFIKAKGGSDTELAAYKKMLELLPGKIATIKTAAQAEILHGKIEDTDCSVELVIPLISHWLGLTKTLNQTVSVLLSGVPDIELMKRIFAKMTAQVKDAGRETVLKAVKSLKGDDALQMGLVMAPKETKEFLSTIAELYAVKETVS